MRLKKMLKDLLKSSRFKAEIRKFYRKNRKEILDIILFGSYIRGKESPRDIDLLIVFPEKENNELVYELRKSLEKFHLNFEITGRLYKTMLSSSFLPREGILTEGYSLILNKKLSNAFGFQGFYAFIYTLRGFTDSQRMRFHYALYGRGTLKGMLRDTKSIKLTNTMVLVPVGDSDEFENFLKEWRVHYKKIQILLPERTVEHKEFKI